jgi:GntR family transcriptional regulator
MLISINENDSRPIYQQLAGQVREHVSKGILKPGDTLPSVRELSDSLGVNLHTVRRAYLLLRDQGIIDLRLGRKARISRRKLTPLTSDAMNEIQVRLEELITDALLLGISPEDLANMVDRQLK